MICSSAKSFHFQSYSFEQVLVKESATWKRVTAYKWSNKAEEIGIGKGNLDLADVLNSK